MGQPVFVKVSGDDRKNLDMIIALGEGGPYEGITRIRFDDEQITLDGNGDATSPSKYVGKVKIVTTLGAEDQVAIPAAVSAISEWTSNHRGRGICHAYVRLVWDPEVFTNGRPNIFFRIKGRKVYDPRKDSTNGGSGAHRFTDPSTWEYSENKALWVLDWFRGVNMGGKRVLGFGVDDAVIDWDSYADAADVSDEAVDVVGGGTIPRYTGGGGQVASVDDPKAVADMMVRHLAGEFAPRSGYLSLFAGGPRTATVTLTDDDLAGPVKLTSAKSIRQTINSMKPLYREPSDGYEITEAPTYANATWETEDGEIFENDALLTFETDNRRAQRVAKLLAAREREPRRIEALWKQKAMQVREGDAFNWSSARYPAGVTGKYVCESRTVNEDGTVSIGARSETTANYGWDESTEEIAPDPRGLVPVPVLPVPIPGGIIEGVIPVDSVPDLPTSRITSGTFANALIAAGNVTQHQASIDALALTNAPAQAGATAGADWASNVANRPAELTDGRIAAGLNSSGVLLTNVPLAQVTGAGSLAALNTVGSAQLAADLIINDASDRPMLDRAEGNLFLEGYQIARTFESGTHGSSVVIGDGDNLNKVVRRMRLADVRRINEWRAITSVVSVSGFDVGSYTLTLAVVPGDEDSVDIGDNIGALSAAGGANIWLGPTITVSAAGAVSPPTNGINLLLSDVVLRIPDKNDVVLETGYDIELPDDVWVYLIANKVSGATGSTLTFGTASNIRLTATLNKTPG